MVQDKQRLRIPNPHGADYSVGLIRQILKHAGISPDDWDKAR